MHLSELLAALEQGGFPVAFEAFPKEQLPQLPYAVYKTPRLNVLYADGVTYYASQNVELFVYASRKSEQVEEKLREILFGVPVAWSEATDSKGRYQYTLTLEVEI